MAVDGDLDLLRLREFLAANLRGPVGAELAARRLVGGRSNLTYAVTDGQHRWVVRRPPPGQVLATAHDMGREYRVMTALAGSAVPVPRTLARCDDAAVVGAPFYVMEHVPGVAMRDVAELERLGPAMVRGLIDRLVDILVDLHAVDPDAVGLADFGRPQGYNERQLRRWSGQLTASMTGEIPDLEELTTALGAAVPPTSATAVVHGDYRLDNVLVDRPDPAGPPVVTAVLDWEMSTLGDPLGDLALMLLYCLRTLPGTDEQAGSARPAVTVPGHPSVQQLIQRYAERSGRDVSGLRWYRAFACFKLAAVLQGVHYRFLHGSYGHQQGFAGIGEVVAPLVADGLAAIRGDEE